jgi:hypothetical protein
MEIIMEHQVNNQETEISPEELAQVQGGLSQPNPGLTGRLEAAEASRKLTALPTPT